VETLGRLETGISIFFGKKVYIISKDRYIKPLSQGGEAMPVSLDDENFEKRRSLLLWVLKQAGEIRGRTRFQKMILIGQKELGLPDFFDFSKHYYGPYSWDLTEAIEDLILQGDIVEHTEQSGDYILYTYELSDQGKVAAKGKKIKIDKKSAKVEEPAKALQQLADIPLRAILSYVYRKYLPNTAQ